MTSPASNLIGLYYETVPAICHALDFTPEMFRSAMSEVERSGFAFYDEADELVWVPNATDRQVGEAMGAGDKRRGPVLAELKQLPKGHRFVSEWFARYGEPFGMSIPNERPSLPPPAPIPPTEEKRESPACPIQDPSMGIPVWRVEKKRTELKGTEEKGGEELAASPPPPPAEIPEVLPEPAEVTQPAPKPAKGTRLPEGWRPGAQVMTWCSAKRVADEDIERMLERFTMYFLSASSPKAVKGNWDRAFQSWVLREIDDGKISLMPSAPVEWQPPPAEVPLAAEDSRTRLRTLLDDLAQATATKAPLSGSQALPFASWDK